MKGLGRPSLFTFPWKKKIVSFHFEISSNFLRVSSIFFCNSFELPWNFFQFSWNCFEFPCNLFEFLWIFLQFVWIFKKIFWIFLKLFWIFLKLFWISLNFPEIFIIFTTLLLGHSCSAHLFGMFFRYQWCYLLVWCMQNITPWGSDARVVGRNTRRKRTVYEYIIGSIITSKDSLSVIISK